MKALITLFNIVACIGLSLSALSQNYCGFDSYMMHTHSHPADEDAQFEANVRILQTMQQLTPGMRVNEHVIPVVVHVIHDGGPENIPDAQIETAIEQLNDAFANEDEYFNPDGQNIPIRFCLAGTDPDGELTTGIVRVQDPLTDMNVPSQDIDLKNLSRWNPELYLNMWVVRTITREPDNPGVVGYATFPDMHGSDADGMVMEAQFFGTTDGYSTVHVHEVGHYLGLYHTFQDGCPNDDCQTSGDWICDTPPDNHVFTVFCYDGTNSCTTDEDDTSENNPFRPVAFGGLGDQVDEQDNYMDYSNLICFNQFTPLQGDRMIATLLSERASLLEGDRCSTPCEAPFTVDFSAEALDVYVGNAYNFSAEGAGFDQIEWFINGESVTTGESVALTFPEEGVYEVEAVASNDVAGCEQEATFEINATCEAVAFFATNGSQFPVNTTLDYSYTGADVTSISWSVDGSEVSGTEGFSFTFDAPGVFAIQLSVSNAFCSDTYTHYVAIGNCVTGREGNVWYFNNQSGSIFGLDFNQMGDDILIEENPNLPEPFAHNKGAFSDAAGNLRYISTGITVLDASGAPLQNGEGLLSSPSAHYGSLFVRKPGSDHEVYLFTCDADENDFVSGLRYHLIDDDLNGGLGGVVDGEKNVFIDFVGMENAVAIRHCNLVDFWLVHYNANEGVMKAHLFTEDGLTGDPVVSDVPEIDLSGGSILIPFVANGPGNRIHRANRTYTFDPASGEVEMIHDTNLEYAFTSAWSMNSRYIYYWEGEFTPNIYRIDTQLPVDMWTDNIELVFEASSIQEFGVGINLTPTGNIFVESGFNGWIGEFNDPDAPLDELVYNPNAYFTESFLNGFQNNYHGYIYGPSLFLQGESAVCAGGTHTYNAFQSECISAPIDWSVEGPAGMTTLANGEVELSFEGAGAVVVIAEAELSCGSIVDSLHIQVDAPLALDLGPDQQLCEGVPLELNAGSGFDTYSWQDGSTESTFTVETPGVYSVTVTNGVCNASDTFEATGVFSGNIDLGPDFEICNEPVVLSVGDVFIDPVWQDGSMGSSYTIFEAGAYWVTATSPCFASDTVMVDDCGQVINSILESQPAQLSIWPNPASEELNILSDQSVLSVRLHDAAGRLVYSENKLNLKRLTIPVSAFESGYYSIELETAVGYQRRKVQIMR